MKKAVSLMLVLVFALVLSACGEKFPSTVAPEVDNVGAAAVAGVPNVNSGDNLEDTNASNVADSSSEATSDSVKEELIPTGKYTAYEKFSGQHMPNVYIEVLSSDESQITFSYASYSGEFFENVTVNLDFSRKGYTSLNSSIELNMEIGDGVIVADELEAMGAMAFEFRK